MDQRLIATLPFALHLVGGAMLAVGYEASPATFAHGQVEFLALVGYLVPAIALGLIWLRNYARGAPLLAASAATGLWYAIYTFFLHPSPANARTLTGEAAGAYLYATIVVLLGLTCCTGAGVWLWYRESEGFRAAVDGVVRPPEAREGGR